MKKILLAIPALTITMLFASCSKCETCTQEGSPELRICRNDYESETEYDFAVTAAQAAGYECSSSL